MADDLDSLLNPPPLSSTEEKLLDIPFEELAEGLDVCSRSLIGKFLAPEEVIVQGLKIRMILAWESDFSVIHLGKNVYQFIFASEDKLNQIMEDGPWCFDGNLIVLRNWRDHWESWKRLISLFQGCKKAEIREEEDSGKRFFRLRIQVKILEPFRRVILLSSDDGKSRIRGLIQYERLPKLCYLCGLCDHTMDICNNLSKSESSELLPFGTWLNADRKSSLLEELNLNELQKKVVEFGNKKRNESDFVEGPQPWVEGQAKNDAANAENQTAEEATSIAEESQAVLFMWKIDNFSKLNVKKLYSDVFVVGGYKWRLLIFPKGKNANHYLSVYLQVADKACLPIGWSQYARFSLAVVQEPRKFTSKKETHHLFNGKVSNFGFPSFMRLSELHDPRNKFLVNDTLIVEVDVDVRKLVDSKNRKVLHSAK